jgi:RNA polymerase sigma-70 factor (ECF subfamily)
MSAQEDERAVERVLKGDVDAFAEIVARWQRPLVNLAYRFSRDRGRAEDMAQDAFVRAYRALGTWRRDGAFSTWLFAVATNVYRSDIRNRPAPTVSLDDAAEPIDPLTIDGNLEDADERWRLRRAVDTLPAKYREALVLFYFHEMDVASAARSLRLPQGTVKARLFRGREMLRGKLARFMGSQRTASR